MKRAGLVGGLGVESTIDYYRSIVELWRRDDPDTFPYILIDSLDVDYGIHLVETDRDALTRYLLDSVTRLAGGGASFAAFAANTPHLVFDDVAKSSPIPLISIVECTADAAKAGGHQRVLLVGTGFTMTADFYPRVFRGVGVEVVVPNEQERAWLHQTYLGELLPGVFRDEAREGVSGIVERSVRAERVDAVVLAGTELPLLLRDTPAKLPVLDTTLLHVAAIVRALR